jgi:hypothetical protein
VFTTSSSPLRDDVCSWLTAVLFINAVVKVFFGVTVFFGVFGGEIYVLAVELRHIYIVEIIIILAA